MQNHDDILLQRWRQDRDADAFAEIVSRHAQMVFATCCRILKHHPDAEDVAQECFLRLATDSSAPEEFRAGWLHTLATYRSLDRLRKTKRRYEREDRYAREAPNASPPAWADVDPLVDEAIASLPDELREPLIRHYLEGHSYTELAESLGIPRSTAARRVQHGIERIRESLCKRGLAIGAPGLIGALSDSARASLPQTLAHSLTKIGMAGIAIPLAGTAAVAGGILMTKKFAVVGGLLALIIGSVVTLDAMRSPDPIQPALTPTGANPPGQEAEVKSAHKLDHLAQAPTRSALSPGPLEDQIAALLDAYRNAAENRQTHRDGPQLEPIASGDLSTENGAHYFLLATELLPDIDGDWLSEILDRIERDGWEDDPDVLAYLASCRESIEAVRMGLAVGNAMLPPCRGPDEPLPYLASYRNLGKIMKLEAMRYAAHGDFGAAVDMELMMVQFASESSRGSTIIGQLVGYAIQGLAVDTMVATISTAKLSPEEYRGLVKELEIVQAQRSTASAAVDAEAADFTAWVQADPERFRTYIMESEGIVDAASRDAIAGMSTAEFRVAVEEMLADYGSAGDFLSLPYYTQFAQEFDATVENHTLSQNWMPARIGKFAIAAARADAQLEGIAIVTALEAYSRERGAYPPALELLSPAYIEQVPADPFTGRHFQYRPTHSGYLLYSAGPDMIDNGGAAGDWREAGQDLILVQ